MRGFVDFSLFSKRVAQVLFWEAPHFQNKFPARENLNSTVFRDTQLLWQQRPLYLSKASFRDLC